ncbi:MAG: bile acid:sodium symporter family protein [Myxococcota bacterium]|jgi:BASS family bile acid:Na+ symporter
MKTAIQFITRLFPLWAVLFSGAALLVPSAFTWFSGSAIQWGLGFIMLGMGLTLRLEDFRRVLRRPAAVAAGVALQFTLMPLLGWSIAIGLELPRELAVGLILVSACPGGTASNVIAFLARADVALSVSMTTVSTLLAVVLTPLATEVFAGQLVEVDALGLLASIALIVILPVTLGVTANALSPRGASRLSEVSPIVSVVFIVLILGTIIGSNRDAILEHWQKIVLAVTLLHASGFVLGYAAARALGFETRVARTVSIEVGMQNAGLATALGQKHFAELLLVPVPCALSAVASCLFGSLAAAIWSRRPLEASPSLPEPGGVH